MKNFMYALTVSAVMLMGLVGCGNKDNGTAAATSAYQYNQYGCVNTAAPTIPVQSYLCSSSLATNGYGATTQVCNGQYSYGGQVGYCYATTHNCAGYTMTSLSTGQTVVCQ